MVETSGALQLEDVLQHRVTAECLAIFNANGTMRKTQKSKLQQKLTMTVIPEPDVYTSIIDMGLIWRLTTPTTEDREKGDGTKYTWGDYAQKLVRSVLARHKNAERIICVNDSYDQNHSIKDSERILRQKHLPIRNVYMKSKDKFPSNKEFHALLSKPENKLRLQAFIQTAFQNSAKITSTEIIYGVVGSTTKNLTTDKIVSALSCDHAEADTAMFTIYSVLRSEGYTKAVVLDTEDTDNYVQAAYVAQMTSGLTLLKRKHELISARCLCNEAMAASIIQLHVLTGCDHNSGFYGASKRLIADRLEKSQEAHNLLAACGTCLPVTQGVITDLERFVIRYVYCDTKSKTLADVRAAKWRAQKKKSTVRLVPDSDSLRPHLERANYLAYLQRNYTLQSHPSPIGHGWHLVNGMCLPIRSTQPPLPPSISLPSAPQTAANHDNTSESDGSDLDTSCSETSGDSDA